MTLFRCQQTLFKPFVASLTELKTSEVSNQGHRIKDIDNYQNTSEVCFTFNIVSCQATAIIRIHLQYTCMTAESRNKMRKNSYDVYEEN